MSVLQHSLLVLPIHRFSYSEYYARHDTFVAKQKLILQAQSRRKFESLKRPEQTAWEMDWFWPPWRFNDLVGFVDLGSDGGGCLTADIFIKRKHFPKAEPERARKRDHSVAENAEVLYYCEVGKRPVVYGDNASYVKVAREIIDDAWRIVTKRVRTAVIGLPEYDLSCLNFAEADRQSRERSVAEKEQPGKTE